MSSFLSTNVCELTTEVSDNTLSMLTSKSIQENFMFVVYFRSLKKLLGKWSKYETILHTNVHLSSL